MLTLASQVAKRPVVTFDGWDVAQLKDIIFAHDGGRIVGFTLAGRGLFASPLKTAVPWDAVVGFGPDAVMIRSDESLVPIAEVLRAAEDSTGGGRGDVLGSQVLTDDGTAIGVVADVVVRIPSGHGQPAEVVGYAIAPPGKRTKDDPLQYIPLPRTLSASSEHLMVPARAREYMTQDFSGFEAAADRYRASDGDSGGGA